MSDQTYIYPRGTKTERITTARLRHGNQVLTELSRGDRVHPAAAKTDSTVRTVDRVEAYVPEQRDLDRGWRGRRQGGRRTVVFTDGTAAHNLAAHQTWAAVSGSIQSA